MRRVWGLGLGLLSLFAAGAASAAPSLEIRRAAVRVVVMPEDRADIQVEVIKANANLPLYVEKFGDVTVVDGQLLPFFTGCRGSGENLRATIFGKGDFSAGELPEILVRTPMDVRVTSGGVVIGSVGRAHSLALHDGGCGGWKVANVEDGLEARLSGSGDIDTGSAGRAELVISGSGRLKAGVIAGQLTARVSGSGAITTVSSGAADLVITGSGDVHSGPVAGGLTAVISGSGDLDIARLDGPLMARVSGVGRIHVLTGQVTDMQAHISGSGDVDFGGVAQTLDVEVSGSGDVHAAEVTGQVTKHISGAGSVHVGR